MITKEDLSEFEYLTIQMEKLVPYLLFIEKELGTDILIKLLKKLNQENFSKAKANKIDSDDFLDGYKSLKKFCSKNHLKCSSFHQDDKHMEFNITECPFTELMKKLNAQHIGHLLLCATDYVRAAEHGWMLTRTKTCMEGNVICDFKYKKSFDEEI